ncbi:MAG TPA: YtxH domain-containing protein [Methanomassiliicoccales archaeon]|nr:YtxH domain-containing protein [Methanomassiliicoccales archaeon]
MFGVMVGVAAGLLFAPRSGKETRQQLLGDGGFNAQVDRIRGAIGAGKDQAAGQSDVLRRKIEETRERLRTMAEAAGDGGSGGDSGGDSGGAPAQ